ncbi:GDSL-type esterase/lipase family protein [Chitinophaga horti]|uniref:GDSL-type esterase/lipase family protein n=1 Tax=Chitinophaga horti TaxID=2920382 RepID=A0ABY6IYI1_9BACT|nr:MBOAT family O-acyltransferase [Chitinophaga horti]UYQ92251.1 GDSL-type esterase/lipase family protein [Chitinophaga horti]
MNINWKRISKAAIASLLILGTVTATAQRTKKKPVKKVATAKPVFSPVGIVNQLMNDSCLVPFFRKAENADEVSVLHLGDSHLQAGFFPGTVAAKLQEQFGNAGRGYVFPYNVAKTNGPTDYHWGTNSAWQAARVVEKTNWYTGPGGIVLYSQQPSADLSLTLRSGTISTAEVLYEGGALGDASVQPLPGAGNGLSMATLRFPEGTTTMGLRWSGVPDTKFYGAVLRNGQKGLLYHTVGINGAMFSNYNNMDLSLQVQAAWLRPNLVILSLGTNEAFGYLSASQFRAEIDETVTTLRKASPEGTVFILTTPPSGMGKAVRTPYRKKVNGKYKTYYRSKFRTNAHVAVLRNEIVSYCRAEGLACWDFYNIMKSDARFSRGWAADHLHFNATGYNLQGTLLAEAILKAFKNTITYSNMLTLEKLISQLLYDPKDPILFNSAFFLFFFAAFLVCYQLVSNSIRGRVWVFTLFSLYFFYKACGMYVGLVIIAAIVDFYLSNTIHRSQSQRTRKALLVFSIIINLGLLFLFKYTDFFIGVWNDLSHGHITPLGLLLPIGISFYTFENLSYTIDVYRKEINPVTDFLDYLFFLSFFPKLMMGPIVRAADFIPQIYKPFHVDAEDIGKGMYLILGGLIKKVIISDLIYQNFVVFIFDDPSRHTGLECLLGVYGYALVIYCDFSGYSDMAIGIARWTGFKIPQNFDTPYKSASITEFWRRWHISLSSWLRDYLYIPLGGNRKGKVRQYINQFLTMLIGGFWHGANWTFILWGALHGLMLGLDKTRMNFMKARGWDKWTGPKRMALRVAGILFTFHFVCFCWIFFHARTFDIALSLLHQVAYDFRGDLFVSVVSGYPAVFALMLAGFVLHFMPHLTWQKMELRLARLPLWGSVAVMVIFIWVLAQVKSSEPMLPIYLQF